MVETSTLVAIMLEEPGWRQVAEQIVGARAFTTGFNVFEAALEWFARRICRRRPPTCYGAAKERRARLVYVGEDFARTDVNDHV